MKASGMPILAVHGQVAAILEAKKKTEDRFDALYNTSVSTDIGEKKLVNFEHTIDSLFIWVCSFTPILVLFFDAFNAFKPLNAQNSKFKRL